MGGDQPPNSQFMAAMGRATPPAAAATFASICRWVEVAVVVAAVAEGVVVAVAAGAGAVVHRFTTAQPLGISGTVKAPNGINALDWTRGAQIWMRTSSNGTSATGIDVLILTNANGMTATI